MLESDLIEPTVLRREGSVQQRRIPFPQRHHMRVVVQERKQLAITPDSAGIERRIAQPALPEQVAQFAGAGPRAAVDGFDQAAAFRTVVQHLGNRETLAAGRLKADQFGLHVGRHIL